MLLATLLVLSTGGSARADETTSTIDRSGIHLALVPTAAAIRQGTEWDSELGSEIHLGWLRASPQLSVLGGSVGVATFATGDAVRLYLNVYAGTRLLGDIPIGFAAGPVFDLFPSHRARAGARGSLWLYAGVSPFVSVGQMRGLGAPEGLDIEIGLKIPFSVLRW